jgi:hypothetical protein
MIREIVDTTEKLLFVAVALFLIFIILLRLNASLGEMRATIISEGNFEMLVYLVLFGYLVTYVLKRLLLWEVHLSLGSPKRAARRRR